MDIMMPEVDGFAATRRIGHNALSRSPHHRAHVEVMKGDRERCLAAGCSDFIAKPIEPSRLGTVLRRWIAARDAVLALPIASEA
jgi:CheY-like chemotaxis protein